MKFPKVELPNITIPKVPPIKFPKVNISFTPTTAATTTSAASSTSDATVTLIAIAVCWLLPVLLTHLANWFSLKAKAEVAKKEKEKTEAATRLVENSTYVVVGASTGLGLELTKQLAARAEARCTRRCASRRQKRPPSSPCRVTSSSCPAST